jgi:hypothetical protein
MGELGDRCRLAGAVHADEQDHRRRRTELEGAGADAGQPIADLGRQRSSRILPAAAALAAEPGTGRVDQLERGGRADIGGDERLLDIVPGRLGGGPDGPEYRPQTGAEAGWAGPKPHPARLTLRPRDGGRDRRLGWWQRLLR